MAGRGQGHSWHRQGMQSGPVACSARRVPCSCPGLLGSCQRAESVVEFKDPPTGWAADSVCGGVSRELGPWVGSCRNSGSIRSSFLRRPLWSWAPLLCTRFSSSTRPSMSQVCRFPVALLGAFTRELGDAGGGMGGLVLGSRWTALAAAGRFVTGFGDLHTWKSVQNQSLGRHRAH